MIHLDTSFVVDLLRENKRSGTGRAHTFLNRLDEDEVPGLSVHVACELLAGAELSPSVAGSTAGAAVTRRAGDSVSTRRLRSCLRQAFRRFAENRSVGAIDLLIATAAVLDNASLVTGNVKEFQEVPGLRVIPY